MPLSITNHITPAERETYRAWQVASDAAERAYDNGDDPVEVEALAVVSDAAWTAYLAAAARREV